MAFLLIQNSTRWPREPFTISPPPWAYCYLINLISPTLQATLPSLHISEATSKALFKALLKALSFVFHSETFFPPRLPLSSPSEQGQSITFQQDLLQAQSLTQVLSVPFLYMLFLLGIYLTSHMFYLSFYFLFPLECKITTKGILKNWFITDKSSEPETLPGIQKVLNAYLLNE